MDAKALSGLAMQRPLRAGSFIVTLFGDVIAPRGGEVWIGNIIDFCAPFGISESLIRTAVSRLVAAGQLMSLRQGRRSFYRLTPAARDEYARAAQIIYGPTDAPPWRLMCFPDGNAAAQIEASGQVGFVVLSDLFAFGPARGPVPAQAIAFTSAAEGASDQLVRMVHMLWDLDALAQEYARFLSLAAQISRIGEMSGRQALQARVLLVHAFRQIALRDPRLPEAGLPEGWVGQRARRIFSQLYLDLSPDADSHVAACFECSVGRFDVLQNGCERRYALLRESLPY